MNTNDFDDQMTHLMAQGHAGTPQVDVAATAWQEGRRRRTRRLLAGGAGGTLLVAAAAATAFALGGGLPTENAQINPADGTGGGGPVTQDSAPQSTETPTGSTESEPTAAEPTGSEPSSTEPTGEETTGEEAAGEQDPPAGDGEVVIPTDVSGELVPIGDGLGIISQDGWDVLPLLGGSDARQDRTETCLQPTDEQDWHCAISILNWGELELQFAGPGVDVGFPCMADPSAADNEIAAVSDGPVAQGSTVVDGHAADWERWEVTCTGGETYSPAYWSIPDAGLAIRSDLHGDDVPQQLGGFDLSGAVSDLHVQVLSVTGESGGVLTGDLLELANLDDPDGHFDLSPTGETGELVTGESTICMDQAESADANLPDGWEEVVIDCDAFVQRAALDQQTRPDPPVLLAILRDDAGDVVLVHRQFTYN